MLNYDVIVIGGGPAGLAAGIAAHKEGAKTIILEREEVLGGILNQCIHNGFGLHTFKEELTGPEYAQRFIDQVEELGIDYKLDTSVLDISPEKIVTALNSQDGLLQIAGKAVVIATGCRERARGALNTPGYRPAGIYSAGTAQKLMNIDGYLPGKEVVILGSGDIGLIMARRMTLEGAKVKVVAEIMPHSSGLQRNIVQCLDDFGIPLKLSHTVVDIKGKERVEGVTIAQVDEHNQPIKGTEEEYSCDTLLLSCGLIPTNDLAVKLHAQVNRSTSGCAVDESLQTTVSGLFACGNVLHVHDLVDNVSLESETAGKMAAKYAKGELVDGDCVELTPGDNVNAMVPSRVVIPHVQDKFTIRFRVSQPVHNCAICLDINGENVMTLKQKALIPSTMQSLTVSKKILDRYEKITTMTVRIQKEQTND